jgi:hypothetical protein
MHKQVGFLRTMQRIRPATPVLFAISVILATFALTVPATAMAATASPTIAKVTATTARPNIHLLSMAVNPADDGPTSS